MTQTASKPRRRWQFVLAISLALNLLVVGLVAGAFWSAGGPGGGKRGGLPGGIAGPNPLIRALSDSDREFTRKALKDRSEALRRSRTEDRGEMERLAAALKSEPMDMAVIEAVFASQQTRASDRVAIGQAVLLERIQGLSREERAAFAERLEEELKKRPRRGKRKP